MQVTDARGMTASEIAALMQKKAYDECELSPGVQAGVTAMFGAPLTAAQVVDKIVTAVRVEGDEQLLYYTNLLDKALRLLSGSVKLNLPKQTSWSTKKCWPPLGGLLPTCAASTKSKCPNPGSLTVSAVPCWVRR